MLPASLLSPVRAVKHLLIIRMRRISRYAPLVKDAPVLLAHHPICVILDQLSRSRMRQLIKDAPASLIS
jgi:hypothetical protein